MRRIPSILVLILMVSSFLACERDDICSEAIQATPRLIIEFYDINEPESPKTVNDLSVFVTGEDTISLGNVDRIAIPLQTNQQSTRYNFIRLANNEEFANTDEINFTYATRDRYVNRACGFISEFVDFQAIRIIEENQENNWLRSLQVQQNLITSDNEEDVHLFIFH